MLLYPTDDLLPVGYTDSDFQLDRDNSKSTSGYVFILRGRAIAWRSVKQKYVSDSTMEAEYVTASEVAIKAVWLRNFLMDLDVIPGLPKIITIYCDNFG